MLNNFMNGGGNEVYITVSPSCGLEMMVMDSHNNVKAYAQAELSYNESQREIADYDAFRTSLESLFESRNIKPDKARVHLSLPTVWFGIKENINLMLDDNAVKNIVISELDQTFIFKRKDPLPCWFDAGISEVSDLRSVFYTAVQKDAVDQISAILSSMGATLVSVGCSLFSDLKALAYTGIAQELMQTDTSWSLMIVNNSGYQLIGMQGSKILEYYEEALPLKAYEGEEIYSAIENSAQIALMTTPSSSLVIVSETDLVSAEILAGRLQFGGNTIFVEDNQFRKEPLMEMSLNILAQDQVKVSLHLIGSFVDDSILPVSVNYLADVEGSSSPELAVIRIPLTKDKIIELTPPKATVVMLILLAVILLPVWGTYFLMKNKSAQMEEKNYELDQRIAQLDAEISSYGSQSNSSFNPVVEIERVLKNNRVKIMAYTALGESIPKDLYLTYFMTGQDGLINIKGCADSVEDVYVFFKNLKDSLVDSRLRLSKLDLKSGSLDKVISSTASTVDDAPYIFEITNMDEGQLKSFMDALSGIKPEDNKENGQSQENNNGNNNAEQQSNGSAN